MIIPKGRLQAVNAKTGLVYDLVPITLVYPYGDPNWVDLRRQTAKAFLAFADNPIGREWIFDLGIEDTTPLRESMAHVWLGVRAQGWKSDSVFLYLIMREDQIFGSISVSNLKGRVGELGYILSPQASGVMSPTVQVVTQHILKHNPNQAVSACIATSNPASERVVERCGFVRKLVCPAHTPENHCYWLYEGVG